MNGEQDSLSSRYEKLKAQRDPFLKRARQNAIVTIPSTMPPEGSRGEDYYTPYQSLGAYGVNNLASKWMLALFPPHRAFYRLAPTTEASKDVDEKAMKKVEEALVTAEDMVFEEFSSMRTRPVAYRALRHLIITGNFLLRVVAGKVQGYSLDQYVTVRSYNGDLKEVIICESISLDSLDDDIQYQLLTEPGVTSPEDDDPEATEVKLYTRYFRENGTWVSYQEVQNIMLEDSIETYGREKTPPVLALRWYGQDGEAYGRAYVDDIYGDLAAIEDLSDNLLTFAGAASKFVLTQDPGGMTDAQEIRDARSGDIVTGDADEFKALGLAEKAFDFQAASARLGEIEARIRFAFLLNTAGQRDAERVTAEEIREVMKELQTAHAGTLSYFSEEMQLPLVSLVMDDMVRRELLPQVKNIKVVITTGVDALSRNQEVQDMAEALGLARDLVGEHTLWTRYDPDEVVRRIMLAKGVKLKDLERSDEQVEEVRRQQMQQQLLDKGTAPVAGAIAKGVTESSNAQ